MSSYDRPFFVTLPRIAAIPLVVSCPHTGTEFPNEMRDLLRPEVVQHPIDTDWFVHRLYDFVPSIGGILISARYSRYVVDLNRDDRGTPLYQDGRLDPGVIPATSFAGDALYRESLDVTAIKQTRIEKYYRPYHQNLESILANLKNKFGAVLLWDAHSIARFVPNISPSPFPDLILGSRDGTSASPKVAEAALNSLQNSGMTVLYNTPFKGGHITRSFGRPAEGIFALQLEMSQDIYLHDDRSEYHQSKAAVVRPHLERALLSAVQAMRPG